MLIYLFKNGDEPERVRKTLGAYEQFSGAPRDDLDVLNPVILVETASNLATYNYMYIPDFGRYYFAKIKATSKNLWELTGEVDVLTSWSSGILAQRAVIIRQENETVGTPYIDDGSAINECRIMSEVMNFPQGFSSTPTIILNTIGPGDQT